MEEIGAREARIALARLLDDALRGKRALITRNGRPIAVLVPFGETLPEASIPTEPAA